VIVANAGSYFVSVCLATAMHFKTSRPSPPALSDFRRHGDVNGDGNPTWSFANKNSGDVSVLLATQRTFQGSRPSPPARTPISLAAADVNGDGKPDLIVANDIPGSVSVLPGNGNGAFQGQRPSGRRPQRLFARRVGCDGSGKADVVSQLPQQKRKRAAWQRHVRSKLRRVSLPDRGRISSPWRT